jgi:hypothetical protein
MLIILSIDGFTPLATRPAPELTGSMCWTLEPAATNPGYLWDLDDEMRNNPAMFRECEASQ